MMTLAIIEDEPAVRREITYLVEQESDVELIGWADTVRTARKLITEKVPDVILMDIQLRDGTAFDLLAKLEPIPQHIIFITAYNHFAIKAIKFGALDYLLKPIDQSELNEALGRYRRKSENNPQWMQQLALTQQSMDQGTLPEHIVLNTLNNSRIVAVDDIVYCKGDGPYTFFFLNDGSQQLISKPLKYYEELLPAPHFLRTHQSYLVNKKYVSGVSRSEYIILKNNEEIPISTRRKNSILNLLFPNK
ncbi:LytR/AlgR family response regulator transcription factor [Sphingobacterium bambusae]|uniref:LytR/AlgR family response regulator transcription factor n=2 Tax=Sphingobacterium bambusae TaxID=662858 RepID=A0ABW6BIB0_9SPHI|nr:LytTR family DNA-binding domain-containing protein [Sphingobacterium bambusae]WPL50933.1 LytTR family DNA-binding domain-containing protein [Sphingobacterium bambusae]